MAEQTAKEEKMKDTRPFSKKHPKWNTFFAFLLLIFLIIGTYYILKILGKGLIYFVNTLVLATSKLDAIITVALITALLSIISGIVLKVIESHQKRKEYLSQKREEPYAEFINLYFKMYEKVSKNEIYSQKEMFEDIQKFQKKLMLWGSNRVVNAWTTYRTNAGSDGTKALFYMENILYAIRKDMGYRTLGKGKLLSMSIYDFLK